MSRLYRSHRIESSPGIGTVAFGGFLIVLVLGIVFGFAYKNSAEDMVIHVTNAERISQGYGDTMTHKYLIWTQEDEVFEVTDSMLFWTFNASDRYGKLRGGGEHSVTVAGWRIPWMSMYRNVVRVN